jgi:hypothetical protein
MKSMLDPTLLAIEGNGAVQVDESPDVCPPIVTLVGPIKVWWSEWDSPRHKVYTEWRDAVRVALVKAGCAVYSPHRAIQGSWNEKLQHINDIAIKVSDLVVVLTPPGVPADGTADEMRVATEHGVTMYMCPPSGPEGIENLILAIENLNQSIKNKSI